MPDSVYKIIELVDSSSESWEKAAANAISKLQKLCVNCVLLK